MRVRLAATVTGSVGVGVIKSHEDTNTRQGSKLSFTS